MRSNAWQCSAYVWEEAYGEADCQCSTASDQYVHCVGFDTTFFISEESRHQHHKGEHAEQVHRPLAHECPFFAELWDDFETQVPQLGALRYVVWVAIEGDAHVNSAGVAKDKDDHRSDVKLSEEKSYLFI